MANKMIGICLMIPIKHLNNLINFKNIISLTKILPELVLFSFYSNLKKRSEFKIKFAWK